ncbi:MAG: isoprenylcysteine carboxylmethyltransferase family protein [Candidatus Aminicenantes bacterium]|nr:MAG: isoprenylcysteine carboxylmethyltransferase family protein [Candidatus Aminicenantes bacterium]
MSEFNLNNAIYRWRVRGGFIGILLAIVLAKPDLTLILIGIAICLSGLFIRTWASGHLRKEKELTIHGPYKYTRNPLYLGNLIVGISVVVCSRSMWILAFFLAYFLLFYPIAIKNEKERMKKLFPQEYEDYKKKVPLFFPSLKPLSPAQKNRFSWKLYKKNREYRALIGAVLFWTVIVGKMLLF